MADKIEKASLLALLRAHQESLSLKQVLNMLGPDSKERTVRRWLSELVNDGVVRRIGQKRGTRYQALLPSEKSEALAYIQKPLIDRKPVSYQPQKLESYRPNVDYYIPDILRQKLQQAGSRAEYGEPAGTYARHIYNHLLIDLSYNSSRLEGNTYSLLDTKKLLIEGEDAEGKLDEEKTMILNHKEAIRYLVEKSDHLKPSVKTILTLHYLLSEGLVSSEYCGALRKSGVWVGGSCYMPLENPKLLARYFELICNKAQEIENYFEQSFFLLVHLSYLQGFIDVNKRTARLAANIPFIRGNLVPISFNDIEKEDYISAVLAIYELQDINPLLELYQFSYLRSCQLYSAKAEALGFDRVRVLYRQQRRQLLREIIEEVLHGKSLRTKIEQAAQQLPKEDRASFLYDIEEDLRELDEVRIVGLGVTLQQLQAWKDKRV